MPRTIQILMLAGSVLLALPALAGDDKPRRPKASPATSQARGPAPTKQVKSEPRARAKAKRTERRARARVSAEQPAVTSRARMSKPRRRVQKHSQRKGKVRGTFGGQVEVLEDVRIVGRDMRPHVVVEIQRERPRFDTGTARYCPRARRFIKRGQW